MRKLTHTTKSVTVLDNPTITSVLDYLLDNKNRITSIVDDTIFMKEALNTQSLSLHFTDSILYRMIAITPTDGGAIAIDPLLYGDKEGNSKITPNDILEVFANKPLSISIKFDTVVGVYKIPHILRELDIPTAMVDDPQDTFTVSYVPKDEQIDLIRQMVEISEDTIVSSVNANGVWELDETTCIYVHQVSPIYIPSGGVLHNLPAIDMHYVRPV